MMMAATARRDDEHDGGGGDANEESEVGDVGAPGNLVGHVGDGESLDELARVGVAADDAEDGERGHPEVEAGRAAEAQQEDPPEEMYVFLDEHGGQSYLSKK
jgi:hypothetical protein